jgi:hypothetical protein
VAELDRGLEHGFRVRSPYNHDPALWEALTPCAGAIEEISAESAIARGRPRLQ